MTLPKTSQELITYLTKNAYALGEASGIVTQKLGPKIQDDPTAAVVILVTSLKMSARLRGIPEKEIDDFIHMATEVIQVLGKDEVPQLHSTPSQGGVLN